MTMRKYLAIHKGHMGGPYRVMSWKLTKQRYVCPCGEVWYVP